MRDLYGVAAAAWFEAGHTEHYALVPASDAELLRAWSRLGFGQQQAYGIRDVPVVPWPEGARRAEPRDVDALVELTPVLAAHQAQSPVFAAGRPPGPSEELRAELIEDLANDDVGDFVAEQDGLIVAALDRRGRTVRHPHRARPPRRRCADRLGGRATRGARQQHRGSRSRRPPSPGRARGHG